VSDTGGGGTLIPLPGGGNVDKTREALRELRRNLEVLMEYWQIDAQIRRCRYEALVKQGFTEAQALELTKGSG
jgi:hypothetical protein